MSSRAQKRLRRSPMLLLVTLLALVFRGALPVGYMPVASESGMHMALCTGMDMQDSADKSLPRHSHADTRVCLFAASALPPLPAAIGALFIPFQSHGSSVAPRAAVVRVNELERAQQARAPPDSRAV